MAHNCRNCGAEIFTGQKFCRSCGRPTGGFLEEDSPTQVMQPGSAPEPPGPAPGSGAGYGAGYGQGVAGGYADTAPQRPATSPVYPPQTGYPPPPHQGYYQAGYAPQPPVPQYQYAQPQKGVRWGWIIALIGIGIFGAMFLAILMFAKSVRHKGEQAGFAFSPPVAPVVAMQPGENVLSEDGAVVTGNETVITRTFPMAGGGNLAITNVNGDITVAGWDEDGAQVKVTKRGGSEIDRRNVQIVSANRGGLSFRTAAADRSNVQVRYEIKLPRELKQIDLKLVNGSIRLSDLNGSITARTANGSVDLSDISINGQLKVETVNGSAKAVLEQVQQKGPIELASTNGSIVVEIKPDVDAQLSASSMQGSISLDDAFGLKVEKGFPFGQHVDGALGHGGPPITIKTMNGSIKITK